MNVRLLRRIQKHILADPKRYSQNTSCAVSSEFANEVYVGTPCARYQPFAPCRTAGCIAGWTILLGDPKAKAERLSGYMWDTISLKARKILGLDSMQATRLFAPVDEDSEFESNAWPQKFTNQYLAAKTPAGRARVAANRIDHFIKTKGQE